MFKITECKIIEEEKAFMLYGIENEHYKFNSLSTNKERVTKLCQRLNSLDVSELHYNDIIDDFINDRS